jgi:hypothetical protein
MCVTVRWESGQLRYGNDFASICTTQEGLAYGDVAICTGNKIYSSFDIHVDKGVKAPTRLLR